jgi:DNA-binding transcriptional ArsR family regulator
MQSGMLDNQGRPAQASQAHRIRLDMYIAVWQYCYMEINQYPSDRLSKSFAALVDPTRRAILARLALGEATVSELAEPFRLAQPTISKHLKVLEEAGLIACGRDAQRRPRKLQPGALKDVAAWIEPFRQQWEGRFANLDRHLKTMRQKKEK